MVLVLVVHDLALGSLDVGVRIELSEGNTVLKHVVESPGDGQTLASVDESVLLGDTVDQLLSGESDLHDLVVLLEVELLDGVLDGGGHGEGPGHRAVLGLADVLTKSGGVGLHGGRVGFLELATVQSVQSVLARIQRRHQITEVGVVVDRDGGRHGGLDTRVSLLGGGDLLELVGMPIGVESELHVVLVASVPVVDLLAGVDEVLETLLELGISRFTRSALHGLGVPAQIVQITSLVAGEIVTVFGVVLRIGRLSSERLALVDIGAGVAVGDGSPFLDHLLQLEGNVVGILNEIVGFVEGKIVDVHSRRTSAANVVVTRVQAVGSIVGELVDQNKAIGGTTRIRNTHFTMLFTVYFGE